MRTFDDIAHFRTAVGEHLGDSPWLTIDQSRIDLFAEATGDHQWIHVDPERAADGPFGTTIAHGFLTLSVVPVLLAEVLEIGKLAAFVNYGTDKVRFLRPVPVGSRVQAAVTLQSVEDSAMGVRAVLSVEVRLDDGGKPACVAELITVLVGE